MHCFQKSCLCIQAPEQHSSYLYLSLLSGILFMLPEGIHMPATDHDSTCGGTTPQSHASPLVHDSCPSETFLLIQSCQMHLYAQILHWPRSLSNVPTNCYVPSFSSKEATKGDQPSWLQESALWKMNAGKRSSSREMCIPDLAIHVVFLFILLWWCFWLGWYKCLLISQTEITWTQSMAVSQDSRTFFLSGKLHTLGTTPPQHSSLQQAALSLPMLFTPTKYAQENQHEINIHHKNGKICL